MAQKNKKNSAVLLFSGSHWTCGIYITAQNETRQIALSDTVKGSLKVIPDILLQWAQDKGASSVRIIEPSNVMSLAINLPDDLTDDQRQTALKWEVTSQHGSAETSSIRFGAAKARRYGIDPTGREVFVGIFHEKELESYREKCTKFGMGLYGICSLQLSLIGALSIHMQASDCLLYITENKSFAYIPGTVMAAPTARNLPLGFPDTGHEALWHEKLKHRVLASSGCTIHTVIPDQSPDDLIEHVEASLLNNSIRPYKLTDLHCACMAWVALGKAGDITDGTAICASLSTVKTRKVPQSYIYAIAICLLLLLPLIYYTTLQFSIKEINSKITVYAKRSAVIKNIQSQINFKSVQTQVNAKLVKLLKTGERINRPFMDVVTIVSSVIPMGCTINKIQSNGGKVIIDGTAEDQQVLNHFEQQLSNEFKNIKISFSSGTIIAQSQVNEVLSFSYHFTDLQENK